MLFKSGRIEYGISKATVVGINIRRQASNSTTYDCWIVWGRGRRSSVSMNRKKERSGKNGGCQNIRNDM